MAIDGQVETDVVLDADGKAVMRAFDAIDARIAKIDSQIGRITTRSAAAASSFGAMNVKELQKLKAVMNAIEQAERLTNGGVSAEQRAKEINKAYEKRGRAVQTIAAKEKEIDKAYEQRAKTHAETIRRDEQALSLIHI